MTPMTFSVPAEVLEKIVLEKITIDVRVLRCRHALKSAAG